MTDIPALDFDIIQAVLEQFDIHANPSEIHGVIAGILSGGTSMDSTDWLASLTDFFNQGLSFNQKVEAQLQVLFRHVCSCLLDDDLPFAPLLPDDDENLNVRSAALANWTEGFMSGFALNKGVLADASDDVNEAIRDFAEISKMATDLDDNEENENAFFEVHEYVRISALMCFDELGDTPIKSKGKITLH
ncbi:MAG: yecA family protein [Alteromonadaceae bacterium]|jgi:yecA family protein